VFQKEVSFGKKVSWQDRTSVKGVYFRGKVRWSPEVLIGGGDGQKE